MRSSTGNTSISLPSFPKFEDGAVRSKWAKEYDRVESELLQHHLAAQQQAADPHHHHQQQQPPPQTTVVSLRQLDSGWSREPPTEPLKDPVVMRKKPKNHGFAFRSNSRATERAQSRYDDSNADDFDSPQRRKNAAEEIITPTSQARTSAVGTLQDESFGGGGISPTRRNNNNNTNSPNKRINQVNPFDLNRWTRVLDAIVHPPVQYRASLNVLGAEGWELNWLQTIGRTDRIPSLQTLDTLRDSIYQHPKDIALNSPRSILVMLKNGLAVSDLRPRTRESFANNDLPLKEQTIAFQHHEQRRKAVIQSLKNEYRNMAMNLPIHDLIEGLVTLRETREHSRLHPHHPPSSMQPWSMSRTRTAAASLNSSHHRTSPNRAAAATPQPEATTGDGSFVLGRGNRSPVRGEENNNNTINRPHSSMAGNISNSLRGFDMEAQFRRAEIQKQKEQEIIDRKRKEEDHAKLVALRRQETMEKIKDEAAKVREKAEERQRQLEAHVKEVEKNRLIQKRKIAEREKKRSEYRTVILEQAKKREEERKEKIVKKIEREEDALARTQTQKIASHKLENALRHQQLADRKFLSVRHRRAAEFKKLFTVAEIADKAERAENTSIHRKWGTSPSPDRDNSMEF